MSDCDNEKESANRNLSPVPDPELDTETFNQGIKSNKLIASASTPASLPSGSTVSVSIVVDGSIVPADSQPHPGPTKKKRRKRSGISRGGKGRNSKATINPGNQFAKRTGDDPAPEVREFDQQMLKKDRIFNLNREIANNKTTIDNLRDELGKRWQSAQIWQRD